MTLASMTSTDLMMMSSIRNATTVARALGPIDEVAAMDFLD